MPSFTLPNKSEILSSLERVHELANSVFLTATDVARHGVCMAVVAEGTLLRKLIFQAAYEHFKCPHVSDIMDVDYEEWIGKISTLVRKYNNMNDKTYYNREALNTLIMYHVTCPDHTVSEMWDIRGTMCENPIEVIVNEHGIDYIDAMQGSDMIYDDMDAQIIKTNHIIKCDIYDNHPHAIRQLGWGDIDKGRQTMQEHFEVWKGIEADAARTLTKLILALNTLKNSEDERYIPEKMFYAFAVTRLHIHHEEIGKRLIVLEKYAKGLPGCYKTKAIEKKLVEKWNLYDTEYDTDLFKTFIDYEQINKDVYSQEGYYVRGIHGKNLKLNLANLGHYLHYVYYSEGIEEGDNILFNICELCYWEQLLQMSKTPRKKSLPNREWTIEEENVFLKEFEKDGKKYYLDIDTFNKEVLRIRNQQKSFSDYCWMAVLIYARNNGFLNQRTTKKGDKEFHISNFINLLEKDPWNMDVKANKVTPYSYLIKEDINVNDIASTPLPKKSKRDTCNPTGVSSIQSFLTSIIESIDINDIIIPG